MKELTMAGSSNEAHDGESTAMAFTMDKCRELSGCPPGVDLQDWVKQLAAENVELKEALWWLYEVVSSDCVFIPDEKYSSVTNAAHVLLETTDTDRIVAGIKASAIPEGFKLVPEQMYLSDEDIQAICMQCGNGDKKGYGDYEDGILWVGELSNDGEVKYGLNIANANYPEEGSITVFEFDDPLHEGAGK
ncbi:hypothetical protein KUF61_13305 [Klebsiella aerogenes]|uniref:hypothetical protein n=1 Tax=Klebsiella aerogenes TaxID=548 RepID=UPI001C388EEA|nr:hypothetical protein [Klebsiella aerogenes]MBV2177367.1 hypothetical protein [Klebsiella aerogenes]